MTSQSNGGFHSNGYGSPATSESAYIGTNGQSVNVLSWNALQPYTGIHQIIDSRILHPTLPTPSIPMGMLCHTLHNCCRRNHLLLGRPVCMQANRLAMEPTSLSPRHTYQMLGHALPLSYPWLLQLYYRHYHPHSPSPNDLESQPPEEPEICRLSSLLPRSLVSLTLSSILTLSRIKV